MPISSSAARELAVFVALTLLAGCSQGSSPMAAGAFNLVPGAREQSVNRSARQNEDTIGSADSQNTSADGISPLGYRGTLAGTPGMLRAVPRQRLPGFFSAKNAGNSPLIFISDFQMSDVLIFTLASSPVLVGTITNGIGSPYQMAFDRAKTLYVVNARRERPAGGGTVSEYRIGQTAPAKILSYGLVVPNGIAIDSAGTVYVSNNSNSTQNVVEYVGGETVPSKTITGIPNPFGLALDKNDNLYVASVSNGVYEVPKGSATPHNLGLRKAVNTGGLAFNGSGDLFVSNIFASHPNVYVYHAGKTKPFRTINYNNEQPYLISMGQGGHLCVPHLFNGDVAIYQRGGSMPYVDITQGLIQPASAVIARWPETMKH